MPLLHRRRQKPLKRILVLVICLALISLCLTLVSNTHMVIETLSSSTRPLWDHNDAPSRVIAHFHSDGLTVNEDVCKLHGWKARSVINKANLKVLDAVLMSSELELLEIRMNELDDVVDYFLILESNETFTGLPKKTYFANNRHRFAKFEHKIVYKFSTESSLKPGESPWDVERNTRIAMSGLIMLTMDTFPTESQTMVIMSDVDEIISKHTINLLRSCDFGQSLHLQLRDYLYSYEWMIGFTSWRASAQIWGTKSYYRHSKSTENILADAGWHCSFCFRTIGEYIIKMKGYSHADRITGRINLLDPKRIQDVICSGKDIFGMLPEAYSYLDLVSKMRLTPLKSAVGLPRYLIENAARFAFLLPGGCKREAQILA
ncbi:glycosyltransferase family 17 protein [Crepidotus variabilis]|uniref:Glycosyltransferase family 17 protein n=1 Tax=Crepidotus variabilis TaxID=179855 RepID=A0A9P6E4U7_9AGAR|nr:glycosyltransferase family 17 protein [Crepidotus variabilis]